MVVHSCYLSSPENGKENGKFKDCIGYTFLKRMKRIEALMSSRSSIYQHSHFSKLARSSKAKCVHTLWLSNITCRYLPIRNTYFYSPREQAGHQTSFSGLTQTHICIIHTNNVFITIAKVKLQCSWAREWETNCSWLNMEHKQQWEWVNSQHAEAACITITSMV